MKTNQVFCEECNKMIEYLDLVYVKAEVFHRNFNLQEGEDLLNDYVETSSLEYYIGARCPECGCFFDDIDFPEGRDKRELGNRLRFGPNLKTFENLAEIMLDH